MVNVTTYILQRYAKTIENKWGERLKKCDIGICEMIGGYGCLMMNLLPLFGFFAGQSFLSLYRFLCFLFQACDAFQRMTTSMDDLVAVNQTSE